MPTYCAQVPQDLALNGVLKVGLRAQREGMGPEPGLSFVPQSVGMPGPGRTRAWEVGAQDMYDPALGTQDDFSENG